VWRLVQIGSPLGFLGPSGWVSVEPSWWCWTRLLWRC
jgi:hypothetical protein